MNLGMVGFLAILALVQTETPAPRAPREGVWRAWLDSPGGELPFFMEFARDGDQWNVRLINGREQARIPIVRVLESGTIILAHDLFDASIVGPVSEDGTRIDGQWKKRDQGNTWVTLPFHAVLGPRERFLPSTASAVAHAPESLTGRWSLALAARRDPAVAVMETGTDGVVEGTILTTTGDYRYLVGRYDRGRLRLSSFDGARAVLVDALVQPDGSLSGDLWSGPSGHDSWTARRDETAALPDAFDLTEGVCGIDLNALQFRDMFGAYRHLGDPDFVGQVRIIELFGTWCPNCHDAARLLVELDHQYRDRGLKIMGLAFELTGDFDRDAKQVQRFAAGNGVEFPLFVAGVSQKAWASVSVPLVDRVRAFPTTIFLDAQGTVRAVYTGFTGPAAPADHRALRVAFERTIEELLAESASSTTGNTP